MYQTLTHQKPIRRDAQRGMVMEATPVAPLEVVEAKLLLQFLIVPLDAPAHLDDIHQFLACGLGRQGRQEMLGRLRLALGPFDEQPFFFA